MPSPYPRAPACRQAWCTRSQSADQKDLDALPDPRDKCSPGWGTLLLPYLRGGSCRRIWWRTAGAHPGPLRRAAGGVGRMASPADARDLGAALDVDRVGHEREAADQPRRAAGRQTAAAPRPLLRQLHANRAPFWS